MADEVVIFGAEGVLSAAEDIPPEDINASRNDDESESEDLINPQPDLHVLHHSETFEEPQFNNLMDFEVGFNEKNPLPFFLITKN